MSRIFYITRDVERAAGLLGVRDDFFVITNPGPLAEALGERFSGQVSVVSSQENLSTLDLIRSGHVQEKVQELAQGGTPNVLVFKNSPQIERECTRLGWKLLNPRYEIGAVLEEKIGQWQWLKSICHSGAERSGAIESRSYQSLRFFQDDDLKFELPQGWVGTLCTRSYKDVVLELGERPIVQFNRGHTGLGTFRLENEEQWKELLRRHPRREVKVCRWYEGTPYTINGIVYGKFKFQISNFKVICGNISKQMTGIPGCINNPYATVGNDWSEGARLPDEIKNKIYSCAEVVGHALAQRGYAGLFGIDVIVTDDGMVILIEVNPRQPASASLESQLQRELGETAMMTMHVAALTNTPLVNSPLTRGETVVRGSPPKKGEMSEGVSGFQLFFRNFENRPVQLKNVFAPGRYQATEVGIKFIEKAPSVIEARDGEIFAFSVSKNESVKSGGELLRIQSKRGIFNTFGKNQDRLIQAIRTQLVTT